MKRGTLSYLSALLCLLMLLGTILFLPSCKEGAETDLPQGTADGLGGAQGQTDPILNLVVDGKSDYMIVLPPKMNSELYSATERMIRAFQNYTGATMTYEEDYKTRETRDDAKEILIGNTYRPESAEAIEGLGINQYAIKAVGSRLVINGVDNANTVAAMDYFIGKFLQGNPSLKYGMTGTLTFSPEQSYIKVNSYSIKSIKLLGEPLENCQMVYPAGNGTAEYVALMIKAHIAIWSGIDLSVVSDETASNGKPEILIGKTNRTTVTAPDGKYMITVTDKGLEALSNTQDGYAEIYTRVQTDVLRAGNANIVLETGKSWSNSDAAPDNLVCNSDVRVMYHNVWGYLDGTNPIGNRYKIAIDMYAEYQPDVIGFQEFSAEREQIERWLNANGYLPKVGTNGGNAIWYNNTTLECLANGSTRKSLGGYDTVWCIFKVRATGEVFGMTNSHFTADSMVTPKNDPTEGNRYRVEDAKAVLAAIEAIQNHEAGGTDIPILCGGDYNTTQTTTAYSTLTDGGLTHIRELAAVSTQYAYNRIGFEYNENLGIYSTLGTKEKDISKAIDHIMLGGNQNAVTVDEYDFVSGRMASVASDHCAHFVDFSFK